MNYKQWMKCFEIFASYEPEETTVTHDSYSLFIGNIHPTNMKADEVEFLNQHHWEWNERYGCWQHYL